MIGVALIEDDPAMRVGLAKIIADTTALTLLAAVSSVEEFEHSVNQHPDVIVLDLRLRGGGVDGPSAVSRLRNTCRAVLVFSSFEEELPVLDAIAAGAKGYVTKDAETDEIVRAVLTVADGRTYFSATVAGYLLTTGMRLTPREIEVLRLVASGETTADIAQQLFVSERTVNGHLERIRNKTGYRRRADLTRLAFEKGLLTRFRQQGL